MKKIRIAQVAAPLLALAFAFDVHAQASAPVAQTAASAPIASKAQNRALAKKVRHALARTKGLNPAHIYVKAVSGAVVLTGNCVSQQEINLAGDVAEKVSGVTSVKNNQVGS